MLGADHTVSDMTRFLPLFLALMFLVVACEREQVLPNPDLNPDQEVLSHDEVLDRIKATMHDGEVFDWTSLNDNELFSAGVSGDSLFTFGYWIGDKADAPTQIGILDTDSEKWKAHFDDILNELIALEEKASGEILTREDLLVFGEPEFVPQATLRLRSLTSIAFLRKHQDTRYIEPMGFDPEASELSQRSGSGCSGGGPNYSIPSADFTTVSPSVKVPWNFDLHNIPQAWSHSQGDNVRVQIIDTGSSDDQDNLGSQFASGWSGGRSISRQSTLYSGSWWWRRLDSPNDQCGHGTRMSGLATAPRGSDGNAVGVAYKSDLTTIRAVSDVVISGSNESNGVKNALIIAGNSSSTKIVSMSIGTPFTNGTVRDGIYYAYNRGKMIFAAAGTSFSWTSWYGVIFPANMSQTVAVTGVKENLPFQRCNNCHDGSQVDFVVHMQRNSNNDRLTLALANSGNQPTYSGGSSCATATTAGVAALVWSKYPGWSRNQVFTRLKQSASNYPSRDNNFGWGAIDALQAVTVPL
jgi:hypothetical protein